MNYCRYKYYTYFRFCDEILGFRAIFVRFFFVTVKRGFGTDLRASKIYVPTRISNKMSNKYCASKLLNSLLLSTKLLLLVYTACKYVLGPRGGIIFPRKLNV